MCEVAREWHTQELLLNRLGLKARRPYGAGGMYILGRQGGSTLGIKRVPAKSVRRRFQDVAPKNYITKVTQRNTSVTKLSTSREDQIIGNIFFQSRNDRLRKW